MAIGLVGVAGTVGSAIAEALAARGRRTVTVGLDHPAATLGQVGVVVVATGGDLDATRRTVRAAVEAGVHVVDVDREVGYLAWLHGEPAIAAHSSGALLVAAAGVRFAVGDLLAALAAGLITAPQDLHVAYTSGGGRSTLTAGERRAAIAALGTPGTALVDRRRVDEHPGQARRLAWFPRPVGPAHAAAVPGGEVSSVPLHLDTLTTIRTYEALPGWRAELLQARANLARTRRGRRLLARRLAGRRSVGGPATRAGQRWGCVAELAGQGALGRAWAYGHDPVATTAVLATELATRLEGVAPLPGRGGVRAPAQIDDPAGLLDAVAEVTDLRWSRAHVRLGTG